MQVRILDSRPGDVQIERQWEFERARMTLRDLIRYRVSREVEQFNREEPETFQGLVQPEQTERILNGTGVKFRYLQKLNVERQCEHALQAFEQQRFLVIAGGRQVDSLDEEIDLSSGEVEFIKLAPLIGG